MTGRTPSVIAVEDVIAGIKAGPSGPKVAAFFDFDGTLIQGYSANALIAHRARNFELGPDEFVRSPWPANWVLTMFCAQSLRPNRVCSPGASRDARRGGKAS